MINRRQFLARSGGLCVAITLPLASARGLAAEAGTGGPLTAYLVLKPNGRVLLYSPTSEMGQGTHTGHAAIIADELNVDLAVIDVETPEPAEAFRRNGSMSSGGSWGMRGWHEPLRKAAASPMPNSPRPPAHSPLRQNPSCATLRWPAIGARQHHAWTSRPRFEANPSSLPTWSALAWCTPVRA